MTMNKYRENDTLAVVRDYINGTYKGHYTNPDEEENSVQTLDLLKSIGTAAPFCQSNIIKYASRFGKKNGADRLDLLKVIHYAILLYYFSGCQYPQDNKPTDFPH
jgi:hypothetical protein